MSLWLATSFDWLTMTSWLDTSGPEIAWSQHVRSWTRLCGNADPWDAPCLDSCIADNDVLGGLAELDLGGSQQSQGRHQGGGQPSFAGDPFTQLNQPTSPPTLQLSLVLPADKGKGLSIRGRIASQNGEQGIICCKLKMVMLNKHVHSYSCNVLHPLQTAQAGWHRASDPQERAWRCSTAQNGGSDFGPIYMSMTYLAYTLDCTNQVFSHAVNFFTVICECDAVYLMEFQNAAGSSLDTFMIQFNKNSFGLAPVNQSINLGAIAVGATESALVQLTQSETMLSPGPINPILQVYLDVLDGCFPYFLFFSLHCITYLLLPDLWSEDYVCPLLILAWQSQVFEVPCVWAWPLTKQGKVFQR